MYKERRSCYDSLDNFTELRKLFQFQNNYVDIYYNISVMEIFAENYIYIYIYIYIYTNHTCIFDLYLFMCVMYVFKEYVI